MTLLPITGKHHWGRHFAQEPLSSGQLMFFLPALFSTSIGLWLAVSEGPHTKIARPT